MSSTTIRGIQLRDGSVPRSKVDAAFEATLAQIESNVASIFNTMSTDAERMAAIDAVTAAWQSADGSMQTMITNMVNATKAGAGLETDGTLVLPVGQNFLTGATSLKAALGLLDAALKVEEGARIAADTTLQANIQTIINAGGAQAAADLALEVTARTNADLALQTALTNEITTRTTADTDHQTQLTNEVAARTLLNTTLSDAIAAEATARTAAVSTEATTRATADTVLQNAVDAEALARTNADTLLTATLNTEVTDRTNAMIAEAAARAAADVALDNRVITLEGATVNQLTYAKVVTRESPLGDVDGVNMLFTVAYDVVAGTEQVFWNGQLMEPGIGNDYTILGKDITLAVAPVGTDRVRVSYFR